MKIGDKSLPCFISITDPKENSVVVQPTFTIKGSVKSIDIANTSLFVEGRSVTLNSDGSFEIYTYIV